MCRLVNIKNSKGDMIKVADIKAPIIEQIREYAKLCDKIDYIYIFGSSTESRCTDQSDIDIAIVSNVSRANLFRAASYDRFTASIYGIDEGQDYDILQFNSLDEIYESSEFVCKDIQRNGALLYEREAV